MKDRITPNVRNRIKEGLDYQPGRMPFYVVDAEKGTITTWLWSDVEGWTDPQPELWKPKGFWADKPQLYAHFCSLEFRATLPNPNVTSRWWDAQKIKGVNDAC